MRTRTIYPLISAAYILGASACSHVQSPQAESSTDEQPVAVADTAPAVASDTAASDTAAPGLPSWESPEGVASVEVNSQTQRPGETLRRQVDGVVPQDFGGSDAKSIEHGASAEVERMDRFLLTRGIQDREPVDETESIRPGERLYAFLDVANPDGTEYALNVRWAREDGDLGQPVAVTIGTSPRWRTWSWRNAPEQPGSYRCLIEKEDGEIVAEIPFRVDTI